MEAGALRARRPAQENPNPMAREVDGGWHPARKEVISRREGKRHAIKWRGRGTELVYVGGGGWLIGDYPRARAVSPPPLVSLLSLSHDTYMYIYIYKKKYELRSNYPREPKNRHCSP